MNTLIYVGLFVAWLAVVFVAIAICRINQE